MEIVQCELITLITILIELFNDYLHDIDTIMRYKCIIGKMEYYIYIYTLIWLTDGSSHPRLQVRHSRGWHVRGLNMSLLPLHHVVEVTYQEKN